MQAEVVHLTGATVGASVVLASLAPRCSAFTEVWLNLTGVESPPLEGLGLGLPNAQVCPTLLSLSKLPCKEIPYCSLSQDGWG